MTRSRGSKVFRVFNVLVMLLVLACCFYPFLYLLSISFSDTRAVVSGEVRLLPKGWNVGTYKLLMEYPNFFRSYGNTLFYTLAGGGIALLMTSCFAYPLSKRFLKGRNLLTKMVVFAMFFNGGIIPNFLVVSGLKLTDSIWAMLLPFCVVPFNLILLVNFFQSIPESIEEAAVIDGMDYIGILFRIVIPLSKPALATVALYIAVFFWNDWFYGLIYMNSQKRFPVMLILRNIVLGSGVTGSTSSANEGDLIYSTLKACTCILTTLPIILLYPFLQRYFITGLTVGGVKG